MNLTELMIWAKEKNVDIAIRPQSGSFHPSVGYVCYVIAVTDKATGSCDSIILTKEDVASIDNGTSDIKNRLNASMAKIAETSAA